MHDVFADFDARMAQALDALERTRRRYLELLEELENLELERERLATSGPDRPGPGTTAVEDRAIPA